MLKTLIRFADCCRAWDLRVSTSEVLDCTSHLSLVDLSDETQVMAVLKTNFAKSRRDQKKFDQVYHLFFHDIPINRGVEAQSQVLAKVTDLIESVKQERTLSDFEKVLMAFLTGNPAPFLNAVRQFHHQEENSSQQFKSNLAQLTGKLQMMLAAGQLEQRTMALLESSGLSDQDQEEMTNHVRNSFMTARNMIQREAGFHNDSINERQKSSPSMDSLHTTPFSSLTEDQIFQMNQVMERLVRKLNDQVSRRYAGSHKGVLDVKQTLRMANRYQGVPIRLRYKDKPLRKANIVTLCDVSGSVWSTARFMLHLLYALQDCFSKVRSFVFVSELAEVTKFFESDDLNQAVDKAMQQAGINYHDRTDYGNALQSFHHDFLDSLNRKTTLMILGDGRSNYQNPRSDLLALFREKVRRIIWLNPEPAATWFTGDSEIRNYRYHCHGIYTCMNLEKLEEVIRDLVI